MEIQAVKLVYLAGSGCLEFGFAVTIRITCWTPVAVLRQVKRVLRITGLRVNDFYMGLRISAFLVLVGILSSEM